MTRKFLIIAAALLGTAALAGAPTLAQQGPGYGMGPGRGMGPGPGMMGGRNFDTGWLDSAKAKLAITPAQDKAWTAYADSVRANAQSMQDLHNGMDVDAIRKMSPDDRLNFMRSMHDSRIEQMNAVVQARDALTKVLDPKQKELATTLLGPNAYGRGGNGWGPGGMMGYGPGGGGRGN